MTYIFNINRFLICEMKCKYLTKKQKLANCRYALGRNSWQRVCHGKKCQEIYFADEQQKHLIIKYENVLFEVVPEWCEVKVD